jgi:hypothetical protein
VTDGGEESEELVPDGGDVDADESDDTDA